MRLSLLLAVGSVFVSSLAAFGQPYVPPSTQPGQADGPAPTVTRGKLEAVIVYRGQAMVTRMIDAPAGNGLHEIVVSDLPNQVIPASLFAESDAGIQVRSVLYRERAVMDDVRSDVKAIDDQIADLNKQLAEVERSRQVIQQNSDYLNKLEAFTAATSNTELSKGVLNAETLEKLSTFIFTKRDELAKSGLEAEQKSNELKQQLELVGRKREEITQGASKVAREAVLVIDEQNGNGHVKLNYLVDQAGWSPSYTINATAGKDEVSLLYQAAITQMSGEDWTDVKMTLSTATPNVIARAPDLEPLALTLTREQEQPRADADYARDINGRRAEALKNLTSNSSNHAQADQQQVGQQAANGPVMTGGFGGNGGGGGGYNNYDSLGVNRGNVEVTNRIAGEAQMFELKSKDAAAAKAVSRGNEEQTVTVTYALNGRTSLQSRQDQQLVGIATMPVKAEFYKLAVPVLTPYVYNEASIRNTSPQVLLAGPTVSYLNGEFVGHGELPTVAIGESFTAGFGIDHSLRASRELINKTEKQQGGNTIATFDYALHIENFGDKPNKIRLMDRIPMADGAALKPTLTSSSVPNSDDPEFQAGPAKKGLLRFDIDVPAQAIGTKSSEVKYTLTLEYDRQMTITGR